MLILLLYIFVNMGVSFLFEKCCKKYKAARVLHAVLFFALLIILILSQNQFVIDTLTDNPKMDYFSIFRDVVTYTGAYHYSALMVAELSVPIFFILLSTVFAYKAIKYIIERRKNYTPHISHKKHSFVPVYPYTGSVKKIYIYNCVMIC